MIWARLLDDGLAAVPMLARSGLSATERALVVSGLERHAVITGLDEASRGALVDAIGSAWVGGAGDAAVVRFSDHSLAEWGATLGPGPLATALARLAGRLEPRPALTLGSRTFAWGTRTFVMGVLNVTPDSFSDGGAFQPMERARQLVAEGADLLDVGGESTRPGAPPVSVDDELARVMPVLEVLAKELPTVPISIDTMKPEVARRAVGAGAVLVNDVGGLRDDAMLSVIAQTGVAACVMHMHGTPRTMQTAPAYDDVMESVLEALESSLMRAEQAGVPRARLLVDPGIGFGKTLEHNLFLLRRAGDLRLLGAPVLLGASRKAFLGTLTGQTTPAERVVASTSSVTIAAALGQVDLVRVHDVAQTRDALAVADAVARAHGGGRRFGP
jgi:dihydropteroate synthase